MERIRALLHASGLPKFLWGEAARHVIWLLNRTPTKALDGKTPYEAAYGRKPCLKGLREWGEKVWVRTEGGDKLGDRVKEGRWMGFDEQSKGFRIYWPDKRCVSVERNVYYDNTASPTSRLEGESLDGTETKADSTKAPAVPFEAVLAPVESLSVDPEPISEPEAPTKRIRKPSQHIQDILNGTGTNSAKPADPVIAMGVQLPSVLEGEGTAEWMMAADFIEEYALATEMSEAEALEPKSLSEAKDRPDWPLWERAIHEELQTLKDAGTWELVEPPKDANIVGSKWVFRAKKDAAGNVVRYKARLVAQGFSQVPGIDYFDTFAPVAKLASICAVLSMSAIHDLELHQVDVKGVYLNGELTKKENIFMKQPPGFHAPGSKSLICHLLKTLYGLKQSGRRWYQKLVEILVRKMGLICCDVDQAVFFRRDGEKLIIVLVHVDDCTIAASSLAMVHEFKRKMSSYVEISDLGKLHWLLGIEIKRNHEEHTIHLSQRSYIVSILQRYNFDELRPLSTPMDPNVRLSTSQSPSTTAEIAQMHHIPYHEAVGS